MVGRGTGDAVPLRAAGALIGPDAPPAGFPTPAPSHTPTTDQSLRTDFCRRPTAGHGPGAARRPGAGAGCAAGCCAHGRLRRLRAACTSAPAPGPPSPPHNTVVVRHGGDRTQHGTRHPIVRACAGRDIAGGGMGGTKRGVPKGLNSIAKPQGFAMYPFYQRCLLKLSLLLLGGPQKHFGNSSRFGPLLETNS